MLFRIEHERYNFLKFNFRLRIQISACHKNTYNELYGLLFIVLLYSTEEINIACKFFFFLLTNPNSVPESVL